MIITINLPKNELMIKIGQTVDFNTPLIKKQKIEEIKFDISKKLNVTPGKIFQYLKKFVGDEIKKGELLAEKKGLFGKTRVMSETDGVIKEINHNDGCLSLTVTGQNSKTQAAFFKGEITEIEKESVKIKVNHGKEFGLKAAINDNGLALFFGGEVFYFANRELSLTEDDVANKVVVSESLIGYVQVKLEALGAGGFIVLHHLHEKTDLPAVQLKNIDDWQEIMKLKFPYCIVDRKNNKIYFYN
jgi:hypothetical protein